MDRFLRVAHSLHLMFDRRMPGLAAVRATGQDQKARFRPEANIEGQEGNIFSERGVTNEEAESLSIVFLQIAGRLSETAAFVRDKDDNESWLTYRRAVGKTLAEVFELGERLWQRFPDLRPEQIGGSYKVDVGIYEPPFYEWDDRSDV